VVQIIEQAINRERKMRTWFSFIFLYLLATAAWADIESLRNEANIAAAAGETTIAANKLQQILELNPDDGATHYQLATILMDNDGDLFDAASHFERAGELKFQPQGVAYRLSRIYARTGRDMEALVQLELLADGGFGLLNLIEGQADYERIKDKPRFTTALATIRASRFPCANDERHHSFDFWIGEWTVTQNNQLAGSSSVQPILGHCTIFEQWESVNATFGKSFNYYDPAHDHWRQIWIGDSGSIIEFTGEARDGGIFYTAETIDPKDGGVTLHKFEFTKIAEDGVRQYWETSTDAGESWQTIWDGRYERRAE
jgi:tetratricopeptide (TPR) repeat protein